MPLIAPPKIGKDERRARIETLCAEMDKDGIGAVLIGPTASLRYFTGVNWHPSERFTGALIRADGTVEYITPGFERDKVAAVIGVVRPLPTTRVRVTGLARSRARARTPACG